MREFTTAFNRLCNSTTPEPNPVEWNSIPLTRIGDINTKTTATQTFQVPSIIPQTAKEILVHAYIVGGSSSPALFHVKVFTEQSPTRRFEKYLYLQTWNVVCCHCMSGLTPVGTRSYNDSRQHVVLTDSQQTSLSQPFNYYCGICVGPYLRYWLLL